MRADYAVSGKQNSYTKDTATLATTEKGQSLWGNEVRGRVDLDARTPTAYGTVQTVASLRLARTSGVLATTNASNEAGATASQIEAAYIRFAGFTFGVARDNFAFMPSTFYGAGHWGSFANGAFQVAYTAVLGGGFSATIAIQDQSYTSLGGIAEVAAVKTTTGVKDTITAASGTSWEEAIVNNYDRMPQLNLRVDYDQSWGSVSLAGVVGQAHMVASAKAVAGDYDKTKTTWAAGLGVKINLPMIAAGDQLFLTAAYADGMTEYTTNWTSFKSSDTRRNVGKYVSNHPSFGAGANGIETFKSWNVAAIMTHFWAPQWRSAFLGSYGSINAPKTANAADWGTATGGYADAKVWNVGTQLAFLPVSNFEIGVEALYARVKNSNSATAAANTGMGNWTGRLRVERTF